MPPRMFATYVGTKPLQPGELALVEVPLNCTIHDVDATRLARLRIVAAELARSVGRFDPVNVLPTEASVLLAEILQLGADDAAANELLNRATPGPDYGVGDGVHQW